MTPTAVVGEENSTFSAVRVSAQIDALLKRRRSLIVFALCLFAAFRVLVFSAAFPFFNSTDEHFHFATVYEYAHGVPLTRDCPPVKPEVARLLTLDDSAEFLTPAQVLRRPYMDVPIEQLPPDRREYRYRLWFNYWSTQCNFESQSPPTYYAVASVWYRMGEIVGARDWVLLYWLRFFNVIVYALFVWISYLLIRDVYPDDHFLCVAVPALLAVFPQDIFFGINRDVLSPVLAAAVLLLLFRALKQQTIPHLMLIAGGCLTAAAFLNDTSNFVLFGVLAVVLWIRGRNAINGMNTGREFFAIAFSAAAATSVPFLWMIHNRAITGDFTGSRAKLIRMGWTLKPWNEIWKHPIFSLRGAGYFLGQLMKTYWRGEFFWHGSPMSWPAADWFYVVSSYFLLAIFALSIARKRSGDSLQWLNGFLALYLLAASFLFLAVLSLLFDFHQCAYPSQALPYFVSGRIISGTLLPFATLYALGFESAFGRIRDRMHPMIPFILCCLFVLIAEIVVSREVFPSPFNLFSFLKT